MNHKKEQAKNGCLLSFFCFLRKDFFESAGRSGERTLFELKGIKVEIPAFLFDCSTLDCEQIPVNSGGYCFNFLVVNYQYKNGLLNACFCFPWGDKMNALPFVFLSKNHAISRLSRLFCLFCDTKRTLSRKHFCSLILTI